MDYMRDIYPCFVIDSVVVLGCLAIVFAFEFDSMCSLPNHILIFTGCLAIIILSLDNKSAMFSQTLLITIIV